MIMRQLIIFLLLLPLFAACNKDEVITADPLPTITLDSPTGVYTVKCGQSLTLRPTINYADRVSWIMDGSTLSTSPTYTFTSDREGTFYLLLRAENATGTAEEEMRIEVVALAPPHISFAVDSSGEMTLLVGQEYTFEPVIEGVETATLEWRLDGAVVGNEPTYTCSFDSAGDHTLSLRAENEDGSDEQSLTLHVVEHAEATIHIATTRNVALGRTLWLEPIVEGFADAAYSWQIDGEEVSTDPLFAFRPTAEGEYDILLTVSDSDGQKADTTIHVECCPAEGKYMRSPTAASQREWHKVYEYLPAPGQFINEPQSGFDDVSTEAAALAYAEERLAAGKYLSLGGFGGYVVVGFDHSIVAGDDYDFSIAGNMYEGSSEAGIVWVMQDTNGNGLPDDEWYELRGSEWGSDRHRRNYAITYFRPTSPDSAVQWRASDGMSGTIAHNTSHTQPYYYPLWLDVESYTLRGSRLAPKTSVNAATGNQVNEAYAWGYADNMGSDAAKVDSADGQTAIKSYFKIANAVNVDGSTAELRYIDFVKVQTSINHVAGALGEISTEVLGFEDENM
ncbi:MAG: PKD domain-containing protein [Alistipes sp.]|nr:PKD domain-containing protein [Alistipes sp.]